MHNRKPKQRQPLRASRLGTNRRLTDPGHPKLPRSCGPSWYHISQSSPQISVHGSRAAQSTPGNGSSARPGPGVASGVALPSRDAAGRPKHPPHSRPAPLSRSADRCSQQRDSAKGDAQPAIHHRSKPKKGGSSVAKEEVGVGCGRSPK